MLRAVQVVQVEGPLAPREAEGEVVAHQEQAGATLRRLQADKVQEAVRGRLIPAPP